MIVVAIIAPLATTGIPSMPESGRRAHSNRFAREITTASHAFIPYFADHSFYPADKNPAVTPEGMAPCLTRFP
jgi:hypothetical protein